MSAESLVEQMKHGLDAPICLTWELTYACNLECIHCSYSSTRSRHEPSMSTETVHRLLDEAKALGNEVLHWSGGEPATRNNVSHRLVSSAQ